MNKAPTIIDVALRAGVSKSSVSNVLQGKQNVDPDIRERVLKAIAQLGYKPNAGARYMRQRPKVLGVVVGDLTNPFHAELVSYIETYAAAQMHSILLVTTGGVAKRESQRVQALLEHRVAAILFLSSPNAKTLKLIDANIPKIFVGFTMPGEVSVSVDASAGCRLAVEHLAALGHREIGFVSAMLGDEPHIEQARYRGYEQGVKRAGLHVNEAQILRERRGRMPTHPTYHEMLLEFLSAPTRPTALVAALDRIAVEIISAADDLGIHIPNDLSVVGFDDIAIAGHSRIGLTTIAQPMDELARIAVCIAIDGTSSDTNGKAMASVVLPPSLVERSSTIAPQSRPRGA